MGVMKQKWNLMFEQLLEFKRAHKHCSVPTNYPKCPKLGRWVATQRYKGRIGLLEPERMKALDKVGFIWSPNDLAWQQHYQRLLAFRQKHGHCDIPEIWAEDQPLAAWVQRQRIARRRHRISHERIELLDKVGFRWAIYKVDTAAPSKRVRKPLPVKPLKHKPQPRLYLLGPGSYVQYDGVEKLPAALQAYKQAHKGEFPAFVPLPSRSCIFYLGSRSVKKAQGTRRIPWSGSGPVPAVVMQFLKKHGVLPPHD